MAYKFLKTYTWKKITDNGICPFFCEWPYLDIPAMFKDKLVDYYTSREMKTPE